MRNIAPAETAREEHGDPFVHTRAPAPGIPSGPCPVHGTVGMYRRQHHLLVAFACSLEERTADSPGLTCSVALSYGGKQDIVQAAQHAAQLVADGKMQPEDLSEDLFQSLLLTKGSSNTAGPPDLLIRCACTPLAVSVTLSCSHPTFSPVSCLRAFPGVAV